MRPGAVDRHRAVGVADGAIMDAHRPRIAGRSGASRELRGLRPGRAGTPAVASLRVDMVGGVIVREANIVGAAVVPRADMQAVAAVPRVDMEVAVVAPQVDMVIAVVVRAGAAGVTGSPGRF